MLIFSDHEATKIFLASMHAYPVRVCTCYVCRQYVHSPGEKDVTSCIYGRLAKVAFNFSRCTCRVIAKEDWFIFTELSWPEIKLYSSSCRLSRTPKACSQASLKKYGSHGRPVVSSWPFGQTLIYAPVCSILRYFHSAIVVFCVFFSNWKKRNSRRGSG